MYRNGTLHSLLGFSHEVSKVYFKPQVLRKGQEPAKGATDL